MALASHTQRLSTHVVGRSGRRACVPAAAAAAAPQQRQQRQRLCLSASASPLLLQRQQPSNHRRSVAAAAGRGSSGGEKWWEKETPNMKSISTVQELVDELADAGDNLVIVDYYAPWCGACRALYPKLLKMMEQFPDIVFLKVDFDNNKAMCKTLGVKVLPFFHIYHGAEGRVAAFSCTVSKFQRMRDAIEEFYAPICSLTQNPGLPEFPEIIPHPNEVTRLDAAAGHMAAAAAAAADEHSAAAGAGAEEPQREPALLA